MANTKISALTANTNPTWLEELVYAYNNANGKMTLNTMKAFVGWAGITTLNADANIWELADGIYESAYDLYYKSWEIVPTSQSTWVVKKHMLFVISETGWGKAFLDFNVADITGTILSFSSFGYSYSSADWDCNRLWARDWALWEFRPISWATGVDSFQSDTITQVITNITSGSNNLRISSSRPPYAWVTYTVYVASVASWDNYTIGLWTGVTNPFNITLPSASTKKCLITVLMTSATAGIVTWCTIES